MNSPSGFPSWLVVDVPGVPMAEPRPRAVLFGEEPRIYRGKSADVWKHQVRAAFKLALIKTGARGLIPPGRPIFVQVIARMPRPKAHWVAGRRGGRLKDSAPYWHTSKPDRDNLEKAVLDSLGKFDKLPRLLWCDDSQAVAGPTVKRYTEPGEEPGAEILIQVLDQMPPTRQPVRRLINPLDTTRGEALLVVRLRNGLTQAEAAELLGTPVSRLAKWEKDLVDDGPRATVEYLEPHECCMLLRRRAGLTLAQLGDPLGLSPSWISRAERGREDCAALVEWWYQHGTEEYPASLEPGL